MANSAWCAISSDAAWSKLLGASPAASEGGPLLLTDLRLGLSWEQVIENAVKSDLRHRRADLNRRVTGPPPQVQVDHEITRRSACSNIWDLVLPQAPENGREGAPSGALGGETGREPTMTECE